MSEDTQLTDEIINAIARGFTEYQPKTVQDLVDSVYMAAVGLILIGHIMADNGMIERKEPKRKPTVNMCSKTMRKAEIRESKMQNKLIMKRYG